MNLQKCSRCTSTVLVEGNFDKNRKGELFKTCNRCRKKSDYSKGKIYAIKSHETDEVYIGSTTKDLQNRFVKHKSTYKAYKKGIRKYTTSSFSILEHNDCYIELIELCPCNSRTELNRREGEIIKATQNTVNKFIAGRTNSEYYIDNKEHVKIQTKKYRNTHKAEKKALDARYRIDNKIRLNEYYSEKFTCDCGGQYDRSSKAKHERTTKHRKFVNTGIYQAYTNRTECGCGGSYTGHNSRVHLTTKKHRDYTASLTV